MRRIPELEQAVVPTEPARGSAPAVTPQPLPPRAAAPPLLLFEHVSKWYGTVLALNQVTLELTGGITGLVGANGAGKSTLLRMANGQLKPTLGRVTVRGTDAWDWHARRLVGYCPGGGALFQDLLGPRVLLG